jgi:gliding motility-associated-like protein
MSVLTWPEMKNFLPESIFQKPGYPVHIFMLLLFCGVVNINSSVLFADEFRAYPASVVFNEIEGNASSAHRSILLFTTTDGGALSWSLTKNASWINTDINGGTTDGVLKITVNTTSLQHGTYSGNIVLHAPLSTAADVVISVTLIINPDVPVIATTWKDGYDAAMSVSVDSRNTGFDVLQSYGFKATYFTQDEPTPSYLIDFYNAGMEVGSHTINHPCFSVTDDRMKYTEIEPNVSAICTGTPEPCKDVISFAWPCGFTNYREESDAGIYFLSSRGYNFNKLEDPTPDDFMNLKTYNSHEHDPVPPSDLRTVIDTAVMQKKWFNMVVHQLYDAFPTDIGYAATKNIWVERIGTVVKYILQRDRFILTDYTSNSSGISFSASRLAIPSTPSKNFELAFYPADVTTLQIDYDDSKAIDNVYVDGVINPYQVKNQNGNLILLTNVQLLTAATKTIEVRYIGTGTGLTISGVTANSRIYDGTTTATLNTGGAVLIGVQAGDDVSLITSGATGVFTNKNIGVNKTVMTSGFTLTGADASKYSLTQPTTSANVTPAGLTISGVTASNKVYDATTAAVLNTGSAALVGIIPGDFVTLDKTNAAGTFSNKNVGTSKTVTISGFALSSSDAGNYTLTQPSATANITASPLTISGITANSKVYDGTTTATLNTGSAALAGVKSGDAVTLVTAGATGTFENAMAGTAKIVYTSGFTITGGDSGNYSLTQPVTTADIIGIALTITGVTANSKVYNGTTAAIINTGSAVLVGVIPPDVVTLVKTGASGIFNNKNVGTGKTVTISGFTLSGADAGKYSLTQPITSANITQAVITVTGVTANNKVYNGTTAATLNTGSAVLVGVVSGDAVTLVSSGATGTFVNKNAGTAKAVTISGLTLNGTDSGNYTLTQPVTTANITAASLTISGVTAASKVYNATTSAILNTSGSVLTGVIGSDAVTLVTTGASGTFANKNAGTGKVVTTSGFSLSGADATNYSLVQPALTADITPAPLTITGVAANDKIYNGTVAATVNGSNANLAGLLVGDVVTPVFTSATGTFVNKNAGTNKQVTVSGITLAGSDAGNYTLTQPLTVANITRAPLTVSGVTAANKTYDGTTTAVLNTGGAALSVVFGSDNVSIISSGATGTFSDKNAGTGKVVTTSGFALGGSDAANYTLTQPALSASILPATLIVTANDSYKPYKTVLTFTGNEYTYSGLVAGDALPTFIISSPGADMAAAPGQYVITISGGSVLNYTIVYVNGTLSVAKYLLTAKADDKSKTYGSDNPQLTITYKGFVNGDTPDVLDVQPSVSTNALKTSDPGTYGIILSGGSDDLYDFKFEDGNLEIQKARLTVTADNKMKVHGEPNPQLTMSYSGFLPGQDESVLDIPPVVQSVVDENSDAGDYSIIVSGGSDNDYSFIYQDGTFTVEKSDQVINFDAITESLRMTQQVTLVASSSSGLPVSFTLSDPAKATLNGNVLTLREDGKLTISAVQAGDLNHNPANEVLQTIDILPTFDNISSLFTPNGDGMNDYWYIPDLEEYGNVKVTVYNRYGQPVYESDSYKNDWDGTWNGYPLPSASYYYIIKSEKKGFIKGVVNIVR